MIGKHIYFTLIKNSRHSYALRHDYQGDFSEKDEETGWNHFQLREYDAVIGRWLVPDPMREFWSPYVNVSNNPTNGVDPTGGCEDKSILTNND